MIVSLGWWRQPVAERSRGQRMNVLPNKGMGNSIALLKRNSHSGTQQ